MACDGDIAPEEISLVKELADKSDLFSNLNVEKELNEYVADINKQGQQFLSTYLKEVSNFVLTETDELLIIKIAIQTIEADQKIEYLEVSFFKKIRQRLKITDKAILAELPDKEDYLLPDINIGDELNWNISFEDIHFSSQS